MGSLSNTAENYILDAMLGDKHTEDFPDTVYLALYLDAPTDGGGGTEVAATGYTRAESANTTDNWPNASGSLKTNASAISFPSVGDEWGTVVGWSIMSEASGGWMLCHGLLSDAVNPVPGSTPYFPAGSVRIEAD